MIHLATNEDHLWACLRIALRGERGTWDLWRVTCPDCRSGRTLLGNEEHA